MAFHIRLWQFDTDGETLHDQHDARTLERDLVDVSPFVRIEKIGRVGAEDNATECGNSRFTDVQLLLDEQGAQHEQACETAQDHVRQMRPINVQVIPRHGEGVGRRPIV